MKTNVKNTTGLSAEQIKLINKSSTQNLTAVQFRNNLARWRKLVYKI